MSAAFEARTREPLIHDTLSFPFSFFLSREMNLPDPFPDIINPQLPFEKNDVNVLIFVSSSRWLLPTILMARSTVLDRWATFPRRRRVDKSPPGRISFWVVFFSKGPVIPLPRPPPVHRRFATLAAHDWKILLYCPLQTSLFRDITVKPVIAVLYFLYSKDHLRIKWKSIISNRKRPRRWISMNIKKSLPENSKGNIRKGSKKIESKSTNNDHGILLKADQHIGWCRQLPGWECLILA